MYTQEVRVCAGAVLFFAACCLLPAQSSARKHASTAKKTAPDPPSDPPKTPDPPDPPKVPPTLTMEAPSTERLTYDVEWRLIHAGQAVIETGKSAATLKLDSAGMVSSLFKIHDTYNVTYDEAFCALAAAMDSQEGKRHHDTKITYDRAANRASYLERDMIKDTVLHSDTVQLPAPCVHEVLGAFLTFRRTKAEPGQTYQVPMSDGRRYASVKIEAQQREDVKTPTGSYKTIRCEANMMNGVIYTRTGRVFLWVTDDERRLPVQIRLRMNFPVGTVTLQLAKEERF